MPNSDLHDSKLCSQEIKWDAQMELSPDAELRDPGRMDVLFPSPAPTGNAPTVYLNENVSDPNAGMHASLDSVPHRLEGIRARGI